jgi:hypothetical protein
MHEVLLNTQSSVDVAHQMWSWVFACAVYQWVQCIPASVIHQPHQVQRNDTGSMTGVQQKSSLPFFLECQQQCPPESNTNTIFKHGKMHISASSCLHVCTYEMEGHWTNFHKFYICVFYQNWSTEIRTVFKIRYNYNMNFTCMSHVSVSVTYKICMNCNVHEFVTLVGPLVTANDCWLLALLHRQSPDHYLLFCMWGKNWIYTYLLH